MSSAKSTARMKRASKAGIRVRTPRVVETSAVGQAATLEEAEVEETLAAAVAVISAVAAISKRMTKSDRKYLRRGKAAEELGLHPITIRRWIKTGKMQAVRVGIEARVPRSEIDRLLGQADDRLLVLYARVSGNDQRPDLDRQIQRLEAWAKVERPGCEVLVRVFHWLWPGRCPEAVAAGTQAGL